MVRQKWWFVFGLLMIGLLAGCGSGSIPHDGEAAKAFIGRTYAHTAQAFSGENRELVLSLTEDEVDIRTFEMSILYVGRSTRPTLRTGEWYSDGQTLTLDIIEHDGEPTDEPDLVFVVTDGQIQTSGYDEGAYDFAPFILIEQ